jgi:hypothetical protein
MAFHIKLRKVGGKSWKFLTSNGGLNSLRVHAAIFSDEARAQQVVAEISADNPEWECCVRKA